MVDFLLRRFVDIDNEEGQGLAEYALILALIAIVAIVALVFLGGQIADILSSIGEADLAHGLSTSRTRPVPSGRADFSCLPDHARLGLDGSPVPATAPAAYHAADAGPSAPCHPRRRDRDG